MSSKKKLSLKLMDDGLYQNEKPVLEFFYAKDFFVKSSFERIVEFFKSHQL